MSSVRIIGGAWRRRTLRFPEAEGLRPTPDRVRETLFNWLGQDLSGKTCLDLFAGSGALGFEAASRGARKVVMVESAAKVLAALHTNANLLDAVARVEIVRADAVKFAATHEARFDLLFLDPPYRANWLDRIEPLLPRIMAPEGVIYVEAEHRLQHYGEWQCTRQGQAGQVFFHLMQRGESIDAE